MQSQNNPLVSIVMPTYNRAGYIVETIDSIRKQTYTNWELLIMDDGSEDNTGELVNRIDDDRIQFYELGRIGVNGKVKNMGMERAKGELIAFMDSDDLWHTEKIEKQVSALLQFPGAGFSITNGFNFTDYLVPESFFYNECNGIKYYNIFLDSFNGLGIRTPTVVFRKECLRKIEKFDEEIKFCDNYFLGNLAHEFDAVVIFEPLLFRRVHQSNHSRENWVENFKEGVKVIKEYKRKEFLAVKQANQALFKMYLSWGEKSIKCKKWKMAFIAFLNAWKFKPLSVIPIKKTVKAIIK